VNLFTDGNQFHFDVIDAVVEVKVFQKDNPIEGGEFKLQEDAQEDPAQNFKAFFHLENIRLFGSSLTPSRGEA
jgi:hypothetical protein